MTSHDSADDALHAAAEAWRSADVPPGATGTYTKWDVPGGYFVWGESLGGHVGDFIVWVAAAVGSGVLGSAAYDVMKKIIAEVGRRSREVARRGASDPIMRKEEVVVLARWAMRLTRINYGLNEDGSVSGIDVVWVDDDSCGAWWIEARDQSGLLKFVCPDARPEDLLIFGFDEDGAD